jgi:hypothetical protein
MSKTVKNGASSAPAIKRAVISYDNMNAELQAAFKEKYPKGYADYMGDIFKVEKPDGSFFYAVSLEVPGALYLVKISVKVDDYEDVEKGLFDGDSSEDGEDSSGSETFPDEGTDSSSFTQEEEPADE